MQSLPQTRTDFSFRNLQNLFEKDQCSSKFSDFVIDLILFQPWRAIIMYLPPIETLITKNCILFKMIYRSEKTAAQVNMKYTNII